MNKYYVILNHRTNKYVRPLGMDEPMTTELNQAGKWNSEQDALEILENLAISNEYYYIIAIYTTFKGK